MVTDFEGTVPEGHVLFSKQTVQFLMQGLHYLPVIPLNFTNYHVFEKSSIEFHLLCNNNLWLQILAWAYEMCSCMTMTHKCKQVT